MTISAWLDRTPRFMASPSYPCARWERQSGELRGNRPDLAADQGYRHCARLAYRWSARVQKRRVAAPPPPTASPYHGSVRRRPPHRHWRLRVSARRTPSGLQAQVHVRTASQQTSATAAGVTQNAGWGDAGRVAPAVRESAEVLAFHRLKVSFCSRRRLAEDSRHNGGALPSATMCSAFSTSRTSTPRWGRWCSSHARA